VFTDGQKAAWARIKEAVDGKQNAQRLFFLKGDGGTGKTYLYNTVIAYMLAKEQSVLATVSFESRVAWSELP
jgi:chromosomal replication initiation ATPase DnaA